MKRFAHGSGVSGPSECAIPQYEVGNEKKRRHKTVFAAFVTSNGRSMSKPQSLDWRDKLVVATVGLREISFKPFLCSGVLRLRVRIITGIWNEKQAVI